MLVNPKSIFCSSQPNRLQKVMRSHCGLGPAVVLLRILHPFILGAASLPCRLWVLPLRYTHHQHNQASFIVITIAPVGIVSGWKHVVLTKIRASVWAQLANLQQSHSAITRSPSTSLYSIVFNKPRHQKQSSVAPTNMAKRYSQMPNHQHLVLTPTHASLLHHPSPFYYLLPERRGLIILAWLANERSICPWFYFTSLRLSFHWFYHVGIILCT